MRQKSPNFISLIPRFWPVPLRPHAALSECIADLARRTIDVKNDTFVNRTTHRRPCIPQYQVRLDF
jgi:hypothetical protein